MELNDFVKVFDRLLPRSKVWNLIFDRTLRQFFIGLSILPKSIADHAESIFLDAFPQASDLNIDISLQFGHPYELDADSLDADYKQTGGQDPKYFQDMLHAAGYTTCFVHEWWVPGSDPVEARNPISLVDTSIILVNDIGWIERDYMFQFGDDDDDEDGLDSQCDPSGDVDFGAFTGYIQVDKVYPTPDIETEYPNYFYVCGATWPDFATIPAGSLRRLKNIIYKLKPMHLRVVLRIQEEVVSPQEYDIQDTIDNQIIFTDHQVDVDPEETIQDYY